MDGNTNMTDWLVDWSNSNLLGTQRSAVSSAISWDLWDILLELLYDPQKYTLCSVFRRDCCYTWPNCMCAARSPLLTWVHSKTFCFAKLKDFSNVALGINVFIYSTLAKVCKCIMTGVLLSCVVLEKNASSSTTGQAIRPFQTGTRNILDGHCYKLNFQFPKHIYI